MSTLLRSSGMLRRATRCAAWLALIVASSVGAASGMAELPQKLRLYVGEGRSLEASPLRMALGNGRVLSVTPVDRERLLLLGEAPGSTTLQLWLRDGSERRIEVEVSAANLAQILEEVRALTEGHAGLAARIAAGRILLEGEGLRPESRARAAAIASLYPGTVVDLTGRLGSEATVVFDARIVELRRGSLRDLGVRWRGDVNGPNAGIIVDVVVNDLFRPTPTQTPQPAGAAPPAGRVWPPRGYLGWSSALDSRLALLEQRGELAVLAEPSLACRSGGVARFVSGGEIPLPVVNGNGSTDVEFKEYGVILDVRPVVDTSGQVFARVETEISQIDPSQSVLGVPGLLKRRSATDIMLRPGETLVLAGLRSQIDTRDRHALPGLGRLPLAGRAFRAEARRRERTELAIFITPHLVDGAGVPTPTDRLDPAWSGDALKSLERERDRLIEGAP